MHACMLANASELPAVAEHAEKVAHALLQVVVELDPGAQRSSRRSERPSDCPLSHHGVDMRRLRCSLGDNVAAPCGTKIKYISLI